MEKITTRLFKVQLMLSGLAVILAFFGLEKWLTGFAAIGLLGIGIPHGAADVLHRKATPFPKLAIFLMVYLSIMLCYSLLWWWVPAFSLVVFAAISAFHFGQTFTENRIWHAPTTLFVGSVFLILPIYFHQEEAFEIFSHMVNREISAPSSLLFFLLWLLCAGLLLSILLSNGSKKLLPIAAALLSSGLILAVAPLLEGFLLTFIIWHALPSTYQQWHFFQNTKAGKANTFVATMAIYTVFAAIFLLLASQFLPMSTGLLFILLSIVTLPHVIVIHKTF